MPVHGTYSHLLANKNIGELKQLKTKTTLVENGEEISLNKGKLSKRKSRFVINVNYVDNDTNYPINYENLRSRLQIGELGLVIISGVISKKSRRWISSPKLELRGMGFPHLVDREIWIKKTEKELAAKIISNLNKDSSGYDEFNENSRIITRRKCSNFSIKNLL